MKITTVVMDKMEVVVRVHKHEHLPECYVDFCFLPVSEGALIPCWAQEMFEGAPTSVTDISRIDDAHKAAEEAFEKARST